MKMECVLKNLISVSKDGEWGKGEPFDDSVEMLAIRGTDFEDVRFGNTESTPRRYISNRIAERKRLQPWDLIIEVAGGTTKQITGRTVLLRPQLFLRSKIPFTCASFSRFIRFNTELCDPEFMFWYLQHLYASGLMHAYHTQHTGVARFQWTTFSEREPLELPPLPEQRRIAGILSAYDGLIENNKRRIGILKAMASALYREWFVHFRFPGHEALSHVASPLSNIPQGWEVKTVAESFEISGGGTPSRKEPSYWDGGTIQWFAPSDLTAVDTMFMDDSPEHITERGLAESSARLFPAFSVMMTSRATIGVIAINTHEACTNQGFITCLPNQGVPLYFLFHWLTENVPQFERLASGATFKEISRGVFKTIEFLHPDAEIVRRFEAQVEPMSNQMLVLQRQIQNLRRTRDLLVPRLISAENDVSRARELEAIAV
jgi:type I restriction enzyme, S subunit